MQKSSKIFLAIFVLAIIILAVWGFVIFSERKSSLFSTKQEESSTIESDENGFTDESSDSDEEFSDEELDETEEVDKAVEEDAFLQVLPTDCKNECKDFQDPEDVTYCKQMCGLILPKKDATGCDALVDLEKDYCLKDQAISKEDPKICEQIEDFGIKKSCKNRLIEDIVDKQMLGE